MSVNVNMKDLLEAGVHYGHQCKRWNPKMKPFIYGSRNGIHIIDLQQTVQHFKTALHFLEEVTARGGHVLFVGTKRQARELIASEAKRSGMFFVNNRWLGGTLTNYNTIRQSIHRLRKIEKIANDGTIEKLTKKEALDVSRDREKLELNLGGIKDMPGLPSALFVTDAHKEHIAIAEAKRLGIPIVAITDTNADPEGIDYIIPGNDDSLKSLQIFTQTIANACIAGKNRRKNNDDEKPAHESKDGTIYDQEGHTVKVMKKRKNIEEPTTESKDKE